LDFVIISLKNHNLAKLRNFSQQYWRCSGADGGRRTPSAWQFLNICYLK